MIEAVADLSPQTLALFDAVIDVRSPAEFAEDRLPGAINLPVLSNEERAEVGAIYVQQSRFLARRLGAAYVARNVAAHLQATLAEMGPKFRPLIYCWRGGMRSNAMATILSQIGWRVGVVEDGYRRWRRLVVEALLTSDAPINLVRIDGETGSAKTAVLQGLSRLGVQTIDLEALAQHKGSVFGEAPGACQPSQKLFESRLYDTFRQLDPARPIIVEAESAHIGRIAVPRRFWKEMIKSPRVALAADIDVRAAYIVEAYRDFIEVPGLIDAALERLRPFQPKERIEGWLQFLAAGDHRALAAALMRDHYDPLYARGSRRAAPPMATIRLDRLDTEAIAQVAHHLVDAIAASTSALASGEAQSASPESRPISRPFES